MNTSKKFSLNKTDLIKIAKSLGWTMLYALVTWVVVFLSDIEVPAQWAFLIPIAVSMLTNLSYTIKRFISETTTS